MQCDTRENSPSSPASQRLPPPSCRLPSCPCHLCVCSAAALSLGLNQRLPPSVGQGAGRADRQVSGHTGRLHLSYPLAPPGPSPARWERQGSSHQAFPCRQKSRQVCSLWPATLHPGASSMSPGLGHLRQRSRRGTSQGRPSTGSSQEMTVTLGPGMRSTKDLRKHTENPGRRK